MAESAALESALTAIAKSPVEVALAQVAAALHLSVRGWYWRRRGRRKPRSEESAELAAHSNSLLRILERFETKPVADKPADLSPRERYAAFAAEMPPHP